MEVMLNRMGVLTTNGYVQAFLIHMRAGGLPSLYHASPDAQLSGAAATVYLVAYEPIMWILTWIEWLCQ